MKISCIMPTTGRRDFVPVAIESFLSQTYENRELVILDECDEAPCKDLVPRDPRIRYFARRGDLDRTIGDLRNMCCDLAEGGLIAHWDDDDVSLPERLEVQFEAWQTSKPDLLGFADMYFVDERPGGQVWKYSADRPDYVIGTSFLYRRAFWAGHRFQRRDTGEDNHFFDDEDDQNRPRMLAMSGLGLMVARVHSASTSAHHFGGTTWSLVEDPELVAWSRKQLRP